LSEGRASETAAHVALRRRKQEIVHVFPSEQQTHWFQATGTRRSTLWGSGRGVGVAMTESRIRPIFVVGYMHSGTTMVRNLLLTQPGVYSSRRETKFFELQPILRRRFPDLDDLDTRTRLILALALLIKRGGSPLHHTDEIPEEVMTPAAARTWACSLDGRTPEELFRQLFDQLTAEAGKTRWLEKTPAHVFHLEDIARIAPDAYIIEVVRDGRDVLASKKLRRAAVGTDRYEPERQHHQLLKTAFDPLWDSLSWKAAVRAGAAGRGLSVPLLTVRYEDLVTEPVPRFRELCDFLGLPFDPSSLDDLGQNAAERFVGMGHGMGVSSSSVGRYPSVLTGPELALVQFVAGRELRGRGYAIDRVRFTDRAGMVPLLVHSPAELVGRFVRRWQLGGRSYARAVAVGYARRLRHVARR
jgi:hypothetical protein